MKSRLFFCVHDGGLIHVIEDEFLVLGFDLDALVESCAHLFEFFLYVLELAFQHCILSHDFFCLI